MSVEFKPTAKYKKVLFGRKGGEGGETGIHLENLTVNGVEFQSGC